MGAAHPRATGDHPRLACLAAPSLPAPPREAKICHGLQDVFNYLYTNAHIHVGVYFHTFVQRYFEYMRHLVKTTTNVYKCIYHIDLFIYTQVRVLQYNM